MDHSKISILPLPASDGAYLAAVESPVLPYVPTQREIDDANREHDRDYDEPQGEREMGESNWDRNH